MRRFTSIILVVILGILIGLGTALIDGATGLTTSDPNFNNYSAVPKAVMTQGELSAFIFYAVEEIGAGIIAFLAVIVVLAIHRDTGIKNSAAVILILIFGTVKGAINYALAYNYKIDRLDPRQTNYDKILQYSWDTVYKLTILHFIAGCLISLGAIIIVKYLIIPHKSAIVKT